MTGWPSRVTVAISRDGDWAVNGPSMVTVNPSVRLTFVADGGGSGVNMPPDIERICQDRGVAAFRDEVGEHPIGTGGVPCPWD